MHALAQMLLDEEPHTAVGTLHALVRANRRTPTVAVAAALEALAGALSSDELVPYPIRVELYEAAAAAGYDEIARMLLEGRQPQVAKSDAAERPLEPRGRPLTLGERKSLARGHRRDILEKLFKDPHPDVVVLLLANPHITEKDVVSIATMRPAKPAALEVIATSERWIPRYAVKRALAFNPYTPIHHAVRLVTSLVEADLRSVANDENLAPAVREQADSLLRPRP